jgi:hypothetical protein
MRSKHLELMEKSVHAWDSCANCIGVLFLADLYRLQVLFPTPISIARPEGLAGGSLRASVRDAALVAYWATQDDLNELNDDALDLTSQPGQIAYEALANSAPSILVRQMRIANGKTLTNPAAGADAVFFFTEADLLLTLLGGKAFRERADSARDHLGLVHLRKGPQVAAAVFPSNLVEDRPDRGRPTAVDAGGNPRFLCEPSDPDWEPGWGRTADLTYSLEGLSGLPERICGPFPATTSDEIEVEFHLLGSVRLPRGDVQGVGDVEFADFLEARTARNFGTPLRDVLIRHLT